MRSIVRLLIALIVSIHTLMAESIVRLQTDFAVVEIDSHGALAAITPEGTARNEIAQHQPASLLSFRIAGKVYSPERATWNIASRLLTLHYSIGNTTLIAEISAIAKPSHVAFEIIQVQPPELAEQLELALWGPYPLRLGGTVGEIVGVVRDRQLAIGIQALNIKTLGGSPARENDIDNEFGADDPGQYPDLPAELTKGQGFRGDTARGTAFGSILQAYTRHRNRERVIDNWGHERYRVLPFADGGVIGSRIALFACPEPKALETLGLIELAEGLPHPMIHGVWDKVSPDATASYLIVDFSEETVDRAIEMTKRAGLKYLYHSSPFSTWGKFQLKPSLFPRGWDSFKACADKARRVGVNLGFHTLSNFITPTDTYVTPEPDSRLAMIGTSKLTEGVDATSTELAIADPEYFRKKTTLNTALLGKELIRFERVSDQAPWRLLQCRRGAHGTRASQHSAGDFIGRLLDHEYNVFLADADLSMEIARNIAAFCNHTGARQLSFDGLEGNWASGYGQYGRTLFTKAWFDALNPELRGQIINDASNPGHFNWHMNTRMNWGEPWYAGFRESQTLYRFKNQVLFERNFMPHMLGWFALRANTSIEDAEWLLARAAGFDAGFTLATSLASTAQLEADPTSADTAKRFGATSAILATIAHWETARAARVFTPEIKALLRDNQREFHLKPIGIKKWDLHEAHVARFIHTNTTTQPSELIFQNLATAQPLQWILRSDAKNPLADVILEINGQTILELKEPLPPGASLKYSGGSDVILADASWKELSRLPVNTARMLIQTGAAKIRIRAKPDSDGSIKLELRTLGSPMPIKAD